jgi:hypothetical protein
MEAVTVQPVQKTVVQTLLQTVGRAGKIVFHFSQKTSRDFKISYEKEVVSDLFFV